MPAKKCHLALMVLLLPALRADTIEAVFTPSPACANNVNKCNWSIKGNWLPSTVPNNTAKHEYDVTINDHISTVNLNINAKIDNLTLGSSNTLNIQDSQILTIQNGGGIENEGVINLNGKGNPAILQVDGGTGKDRGQELDLSGGGIINLSDNANNRIRSMNLSPLDSLVNFDNTIQGAGTIKFNFDNSGTLIANGKNALIIESLSAPNPITGASGGFTNDVDGVVQVNAGSKLEITGPRDSFNDFVRTTGTLSSSGTYIVSGTLQFTDANIVTNDTDLVLDGPSFKIVDQNNRDALRNLVENTGSLTLRNFATLSRTGIFTNKNDILVTAGSTLKLSSAVFNNDQGTLTIENGSTPFTSTLNLSDVNFNGGTVTLSDTSQILMTGNNLFNAVSLSSDDNTNIMAFSGRLDLINFTQIDGGTLTLNGTELNLTDSSVTNGTVMNNGGAIIAVSGSNQIDGLNNGQLGLVQVNVGAVLTLTGDVVNSGLISNSGSLILSEVSVANNTLIQNQLELQLSDASITGGVLTNASGATLEALQDTSNSINGQLTNAAGGWILIDSGASLDLSGGPLTNQGAITAAGDLSLEGVLNNTGGKILVIDGGSLTLNTASILGGTLTSGLRDSASVVVGPGPSLITADFNNEAVSNLEIQNGGALTIAGGFLNSGSINIDDGGTLAFSGVNRYLTGGGTLTLGGPGSLLTGASPSDSLVNVDNFISGFGTISGMGLTNYATISANVAGEALVLTQLTGPLQNFGMIQATDGGILSLNGVVINGGQVSVDSGGTLVASGGSNTISSAFTNGANGTVEVQNAANLAITGAFTNAGSVNIDAGGTLAFSGPNRILSGGGSITLGGPGSLLTGTNPSVQLINLDNTISGAGTIANVGLTNASLINANVDGQALVLTQITGAVQNSGTLSATGGGILSLNGVTINNSAAGLVLADAGEVQVNSATVNGGQLTVASAGTLHAASGVNLVSSAVSVAPDGNVVIDNGASLQFTGTFNNFASKTLTGGNHDVRGTWQFAGADIVTNRANIILDGASSRILGNGGVDALQNFAVNGSGASFTIQNGRNLTRSDFTNSGLITVGDASILRFESGAVANSGGTIQVAGTGTLQVAGSTITGGIVNNVATGLIEIQGVSTLDTFLNNPTGAKVAVDNGASLGLTATGTYHNAGDIQLNSTGGATQLLIEGGLVTLQGGGTVTLSNNPGNLFTAVNPADTLLNVDNIIHGAGTIRGMGLINQGTIIADAGNPLIINPSAAGFLNSNLVRVEDGSSVVITGPSFLNYNTQTKTLTGGTFEVSGVNRKGTLQFDGADIVTNQSNIILDGAASMIVDQFGQDGLRDFAVNGDKGQFSISDGRNVAVPAQFMNSGMLTIGTGSKFAVNTGNFTQTAGGSTSVADADSVLQVAKGQLVDLQGGVLSGNGTVIGDVRNAAAVEPGTPGTSGASLFDAAALATPGLLTVNGNYVQTADGTFLVTISGLERAIGYSALDVVGAVSLDGMLNVDVTANFITCCATFDLIHSETPGGLSGQFAGITISGLDSKYRDMVFYTGSDAYLKIYDPACPEPASIFLIAAGLALLLLRRRPFLHRFVAKRTRPGSPSADCIPHLAGTT